MGLINLLYAFGFFPNLEWFLVFKPLYFSLCQRTNWFCTMKSEIAADESAPDSQPESAANTWKYCLSKISKRSGQSWLNYSCLIPLIWRVAALKSIKSREIMKGGENFARTGWRRCSYWQLDSHKDKYKEAVCVCVCMVACACGHVSVPMISHVSVSDGLSVPVPSGNDIIGGFSLVFYASVSANLCADKVCDEREH